MFYKLNPSTKYYSSSPIFRPIIKKQFSSHQKGQVFIFSAKINLRTDFSIPIINQRPDPVFTIFGYRKIAKKAQMFRDHINNGTELSAV